MKAFYLAIFAVVIVFKSQPVLADNERVVNFLNWGEYIAPSIVPDFEKTSGIHVNQDYFDDPSMLKAKLMSGNNGYDLVVPTLSDMQQEIPAGLFRPLDKSKLSNYALLDPVLMKKLSEIDANNTYGLIYSWGTTGIGYNVDRVREVLGPGIPIDDWNILFDPQYAKKLASCGIAFLDTTLQVYAVTLHYLGLDPNTHNPKDYEMATDYLFKLRPYITYFSNANYIFDLASGNICIVMGYSGDVMRAKHYAELAGNGVHIHYVIPKSGAPIWFDMMAIPKDAPHPEAAEAFMNHLISPKVAAVLSNFVFQPNATPTSTPDLLPDLRDPNVTPDATTIARLFQPLVPPNELNQIVNRLWLEVRYGIRD